MINLQRLNYLKEKSRNESLQFVAQYILAKIQRDKSEFSNYSNEEDWMELDQFLKSIDIKKRSKDYQLLKEMVLEISDPEGESLEDENFERALIQHLELKNS